MSSVDDPEKHFLGNLLEDDPGSPAVSSIAPAFARSNDTTMSQMTNVGPVMRPVTDPSESSAWPEPPPPYSPRLDWGLYSNANTTLTSSTPPTTTTSWYPFMDRKETSASELLFSLGGSSSTAVSPPTPSHGPLPPSPQIHHFHHNLHHHTHTHNVQVQNHYFGAPPPGLEAYGPRPSTSSAPQPVPSTAPLYESVTPNWSYAGLDNINTNSTSLLFSDWKKENMSHASPEPTVVSESSASTTSLESEDLTIQLPLSPSEVVERAKEKKSISKSYADHLSKTKEAATSKKGSAIGAEKKHKQDLAKKMSSQTLGEDTTSRIVVKEQPHSAPVVSKMPFSYRDVAARVEQNPTHIAQHHDELAHSPQEKKERAPTDTKSSDTKAVQTKTSEILLNDSIKEANDSSKKSESSRKSRADNEFQKINSRKNKKEKNSTVAAAPLIYESVHPVDASSRYDVLKNLESVPVQRNGKKLANRPPLIQEIFSRSSSPADDMEDTEEEETHRTRSASNHAHMNASNQMKKEQKKRVVQANQRRRKGRKAEPTWFDAAIGRTVEILMLLWGAIIHGFQWTFELIVDVSVKIYDVAVQSLECIWAGAWKGVRKLFMFLISCIFYIGCYCKRVCFVSSFTLVKLLGILEDEEELKQMDWGCKKEIPIPTNATEYADRLSRETIRDAYSVFGLKSDCSDDDIKRNYKRLVALVSPEKCNIEAVDEVFFLVTIAFEAIGTQEARTEYTAENSKDSEMHEKVLNAWRDMSTRVEEARNTIFCDCSKRHFRVATSILPAQARSCKRCGIKHPAKQNDIWIEKRLFGFTSVYLTCTDNVVYDITEWATCESQRAMLKNMRAHTHHVQYRLLSPMNPDYDVPSQYFNSSLNYPTSPTDARFLSDLQEEYSSILRQRSLAQISFKTCEPREEDRSRRAANRRQKRWR